MRTPGSAETSAEVAERLRRRYPRSRLPRPVLIGLVVLLATAAVGWLVWAASANATPDVSAQVVAYRVLSDREMSVTVTVDRPDPSRSATCRLVAQATDFQPVAETQLDIPPAADRLADLTVTLTTLRRATSARVLDCVSS